MEMPRVEKTPEEIARIKQEAKAKEELNRNRFVTSPDGTMRDTLEMTGEEMNNADKEYLN